MQQPQQQPLPALAVHYLTAGYPGDKHAIANINFSVEHGERVAIIGPNGAGKSTLFKAIVGLIPFTKGHISINGHPCDVSHNQVGYVPQHSDIDWSFPVSVYDVVMMGRARHMGWLRWPRPQDHNRVRELLDQLSLTRMKDRQIGELSGGQKRRVFIARALAQETQVLLMDEPFTGVDSAAEHEIMETLDQLTASGITMLMATHHMGKARQDFDKVLLLNGKVIAYGAPDEVFRPHILREAYGTGVQVVREGDDAIMIMDEHGCEGQHA